MSNSDTGTDSCHGSLSHVDRKSWGSQLGAVNAVSYSRSPKFSHSYNPETKLIFCFSSLICYSVTSFQCVAFFSYTWLLGEFLCKGLHYFQTVSMICSALTLTAMSVERYLILRPSPATVTWQCLSLEQSFVPIYKRMGLSGLFKALLL